jgi:uncharacterized protein involved in exopolysaccharide biosynthesis
MASLALHSETVDVADFVRTIVHGWRQVLLGIAMGLLVAAAIILFVPPRFKGQASVIVRAPEKTGSVMAAAGRLAGGSGGNSGVTGAGSLADAASNLLPDAFGGSPIETEIQIFESRALAMEAVDSLQLQARVISGPRRAPWQIFTSSSFPGAFKRKKLHFARAGASDYTVTGWGAAATARPGQRTELANGASFTLAATNDLPAEFDIAVYDREEATTRFLERTDISKKGGEVIGIKFSAYDSLTAAAVPNLLVRRYLELRKTADRGVNQRRVEFLTAQVDSTERALAETERLLRMEQEESGVIDPAVVTKLDLQRLGLMRTSAGELDLERGAITQLLQRLAEGRLSPRELAAYPTFLKSSGINDLLSQLNVLETKRLELLATLTPEDPTVIATSDAIKNIENQLLPLAQTYQMSLDRQRADLTKQIDTVQNTLATMPATSEVALRRQRDVLRLASIGTAERAQLVDAKLAAIGEGGDVRTLDTALPPRKVSFPTKPLTFSAGAAGGLLLGLFLAVVSGSFGRYVRDPYTIERQVGVPALALEDETPLLLAGSHPFRAVLLVPLDADADTAGVAERVIRSAQSRGLTGTILDLSNGGIAGNGSGAIATLLKEFEFVAVRLPKLATDTTLGALGDDRPVVFVASPGGVDRRELASGVETLKRFGVSCAGVVVSRRRSSVLPRLG